MGDLFDDDDLEEAEYRAAREVLEEILGSLPSRFMVLLELHRLVIADSKDVIVDKWEKLTGCSICTTSFPRNGIVKSSTPTSTRWIA